MIALAHVLTHGSGDVEDIVHESFIKVRARWAQIDNPDAYLRRTIVHACYHHGRDARRHDAKHAQLRGDRGQLSGADAVDELWDVLSTLSVRQRQAIVLHYYEDLPVAAIAELTDQAPNTVKSHLDRGRAALRKALTP